METVYQYRDGELREENEWGVTELSKRRKQTIGANLDQYRETTLMSQKERIGRDTGALNTTREVWVKSENNPIS